VIKRGKDFTSYDAVVTCYVSKINEDIARKYIDNVIGRRVLLDLSQIVIRTFITAVRIA
jgi:hypothetical protein